MNEERPGTIHVLHVDDDSGICDLTRTFLERADAGLSVVSETSATDVPARLATEPIDCVVSDYDMPEMDGLALLEAVRADHPDLPFVLFTGKGSEEIASDAIAAGVSTYLQKEPGTDQFTVLANEVRNLVSRHRAERRADQQTRINDVVRKVNRRLVLADSRADIEQTVCEIIAESDAYSFAWVAREDAATGRVYPIAQAGIPFDPEQLSITTNDGPTGRGPVGRAFRTGETQVVGDTSDLSLPEWREITAEHDIQSLAAVPLTYDGTTYGVLDVYADRPSAFDETEVSVLSELGDTIAAAIDGVLTAEELTRRNRAVLALHEATQEMMTACTVGVARIVSETARSILDLPINAIYVANSDGQTLSPAAETEAAQKVFHETPALHEGEGIAWEVYQTGEPKVYRDVSSVPGRYNRDTKVRSEMLLPIGDHGVFIAGSTTPGEFDSTDVSLAKLLVANAEAALDRARREETIRDREAEVKQKNDRLEEFSSVVSHDLRNPLSIAQGCLQLAREEPDDDHLDTVSNALDRMENLIDELLTLARRGQRIGDTEAVELADAVTAAWGTTASGHHAQALETDDLGTVAADPGSLRQLLENLFRNALDHGDEDVTIAVERLETGFAVADDGPGIPTDEREQVFDPGFSTSKEGSGLGLNIVRRIVEAHGWEISIADGKDGGARFEVTGVEFVETATDE